MTALGFWGRHRRVLIWAVSTSAVVACVTVVKTYEVDVTVEAPCSAWPDEVEDGDFELKVYRADESWACDSSDVVACQTSMSVQTACDTPASTLLRIGYLPETIGVTVKAPSGTMGYQVFEIQGAGIVRLEPGPGLNDWSERPSDFCLLVSACMFGEEDAARYCTGEDHPYPSETPETSQTPAAPSTTPRILAETSPPGETTATPSSGMQTPLPGTPGSPTDTPIPESATPPPPSITPTPAASRSSNHRGAALDRGSDSRPAVAVGMARPAPAPEDPDYSRGHA